MENPWRIIFWVFLLGVAGRQNFHTTPNKEFLTNVFLFVNMLKPPYRFPYKNDNDDGPGTVNPEEEEKLKDGVDESEGRAEPWNDFESWLHASKIRALPFNIVAKTDYEDVYEVESKNKKVEQ